LNARDARRARLARVPLEAVSTSQAGSLLAGPSVPARGLK